MLINFLLDINLIEFVILIVYWLIVFMNLIMYLLVFVIEYILNRLVLWFNLFNILFIFIVSCRMFLCLIGVINVLFNFIMILWINELFFDLYFFMCIENFFKLLVFLILYFMKNCVFFFKFLEIFINILENLFFFDLKIIIVIFIKVIYVKYIG